MKAGIAIALSVLHGLSTRPRRGPVEVLLVPDEEHASVGARGLVPGTSADGAILLEPTGLQLGTSQSGRIRFTIAVGDRSESARMLLGMVPLSRSGLRFAVREEPVPLLILERIVDPSEHAGLLANKLAAGVSSVLSGKFSVDIRESFLLDERQPIVRAVARHAERCNIMLQAVHVGGWTEAGIFVAEGVPCLVFGPGGGGAHSSEEWVDLTQAEKAARVVLDAAEDFCA
jgi:acetylornithine deacetylase